jgi:hypothetical protein
MKSSLSSSDGVKYDHQSNVLAKNDGDGSVACFIRNLVRINSDSFRGENAPSILLAAGFLSLSLSKPSSEKSLAVYFMSTIRVI